MKHTVLIVDDEPRIFNALRRALHRENYELLSAPDAEASLAILADRPVDVIIADENMPGMKGSALLARVRQQWPDVVRMMLTGDARLETVVAAVNRGEIFRFFIKPCNEVELIVSIRDALQLRSPEKASTGRLNEAKGGTDSAEATHPLASASEPMPIRLDGKDSRRAPGRGSTTTVPGVEKPENGVMDGETSGAVFRLEGSEISNNVDSLLDEIRNELEKLDS